MADDNKIISSFSKGIAAINVKTSSFLETNKINTFISSVTDEIKDLKIELGETVYGKWKADEDFIEEAAKFCASIKEKEELIAELNIQKQNIEERDKQILGKKEKSESQAAAPVVQDGSAYFCPNCGSGFVDKINFCKKCGQKMS